jgi:hypothetical protein
LSRRAHRTGLLLAAALLVLVAGGVGPVTAQEAEPTRPRLVSQTPWVAEDQPVELAFALDGGLPEGGTVELTLYGALTSREVLVRGTADPTLLGEQRDALSIPTALVPTRADGAFRLLLTTDGSPAGLPVSDPGVYPLEIAVAGTDGVPGPPLLTWIVRTADDAGATPLRTAVVLPLHVRPSFGPDGVPEVTARARALLETRARILEKFRDVSLTVAPTPELIDAVAQTDPGLLEQVAAALAPQHVVTGTYVRLDLTAYADVAELTQPLEDQFEVGTRTLRRTLGRPVDLRTWVGPGNPTSSALDALRDNGMDRALLRRESVTGADLPIDEPVVVTGGTGQTIAGVLADPALRTHVNGTADPVLAAQRALADLALLSATPAEGGVALSDGTAGVVVKLPANQPLPAPFLDTLLEGLRAGGPLRPVSLAELFAADPHGTVEAPEPGPTVVGAPLSGQDLAAYGHNLAATTEIVNGYSTFAGRVDPLTNDLRRRLLVSGSNDLTETQRGAYLRSVSLAIADQSAEVQITDDETVTLTSREGDIPITIRNDTGGPVEVRIAFDSDNKLDFPDGASQRRRLLEGPNRIEVPVVARTSGAFPLRITVTSPDGVLTVGRAQVTVRSTAVSGVGVVLSVGALLVLVVWWARHWRTARRNRRLVDPDPPTSGNPDEAAPV